MSIKDGVAVYVGHHTDCVKPSIVLQLQTMRLRVRSAVTILLALTISVLAVGRGVSQIEPPLSQRFTQLCDRRANPTKATRLVKASRGRPVTSSLTVLEKA